ncbi:receptor-type tyrosine-protein phosphatase C isoform X2 [Hemicordylus capensis]|uniref:receptor-type tyrosine-protein phosphatase C isoform X2 n=1 Tax=Hemicordylus capensis TaxID=884348 RepID=UPI0023034429|nr:receptor-type tyrosine-protein phosphatase C isoform X2 [Hemicordylus capensis]
MFLWLKLLAFGLALVDMDVFGQDPPPTSKSNTVSTKGDQNNFFTHTSISPSSNTSTNSTPAPTAITTGKIELPSTPKDCSNIHLSVVNYKYHNLTASATLAINNPKENVLMANCSPQKCEWSKGNNEISELKPCEHYTIQANVSGCSELIETEEFQVPPDPDLFHLFESWVTNTTVKLSWNISTKINCTLMYSYECDGKSSNKNNTFLSNGIISGLSPNKDYNCMSTIYVNNHVVKTEQIQITTKYGKPKKPKDLTMNMTSRTISISWEKPSDTENGPIDGYKGKIESKPKTEPVAPPPPPNSFDVPSNRTIYTWHDLEPFSDYIVRVWAYTNVEGAPIDGEEDSHEIKTASEKPYPVTDLQGHVSDKTNNAIDITCKEPEHSYGPQYIYILKWGGKNYTNRECNFNVADLSYLTSYTFEVTFNNGDYSSDPQSIAVTTRYNPKALIIFLAFLIIVTAVALLFVLYKIYILNREKSRNANESEMLVPRDYEKELMNIDPIPAELLWEAYKRKIADEGRLFLDEFQSIPRVFSKFTIKEARKTFNQNKNRYIDILPYDYNRVELSGTPSDPGSDYINASHIDGFKEPRKYIAAQGPKDETTDDFWRMIWEQKATIIVMVTRCEEGNRIKCAKYWPSKEEETASYGDIVVKINECKVCPDYTIQKLHITNRREKTTGRDVTHIQFTSWPDHGVPDDAHLLLKLRRRVNALSNFFSGPIVVHCSAGVGRTGTYIGIDAMLEGLETEGRVDVYGYVVKLRRQRCLMVQVEAQYILIHQALVEYVQYGETEVSILELHNYLNHLKKRDPPTESSLLEAEFQRLPSYKNWQTQRAGHRDENKSKNRSSAVIPYDYNRVLFKQEEEGSRESEHSNASSDEESDCEEPNRYINASFITGYWLQNAMIATQGPLPETTGDFWNMVYQRKVKVIVMLTELKNDTQELSAQYWGEGKKTYDGLTVDLKDTNCCSSYTIRAFELTHGKRKETRTVFHYQYQKWNSSVLPENPKDLVTMIQNLKQKLPTPNITEETNLYSKNVPLVVHCRDGSQQTGVFCALMNLLDSAETEGVIDVFQVVKSLRKARTGMISSFEDYQFLYDAVASMYPAQNGQLQKNQCQEHKINIENNEEKEEEANSISTELSCPVQETTCDVEMHEDSKPQDGSREAESSSNGPRNPVLMESA